MYTNIKPQPPTPSKPSKVYSAVSMDPYPFKLMTKGILSVFYLWEDMFLISRRHTFFSNIFAPTFLRR